MKSKLISDGKSLDQKCGNPDLLGSSHRANRVWQRSVQQSSSNCKIEYLVLWVLRKHLWHFCQSIQMFKSGFSYFGLFFYWHLFFYKIMIFDLSIIVSAHCCWKDVVFNDLQDFLKCFSNEYLVVNWNVNKWYGKQ